MKIIILGPAHPLRPGGITTFNERLCRAFSEAGHSSEIWSFYLQYPSFLFPGSSQFTDAPPPKGLVIKSLLNSINPINWMWVGLKLKKERPDLIIVRYWLPFMGACLGTILRLAKNRHTKIICIADNIIPHEKRPGDSLLTKYFIGPVDAFMVMSESVLKDLVTFTLKPAKLLPHPLYDNFGDKVDKHFARNYLENKYSYHFETNEPLLVFFGLVRHYKGLDILLEALVMNSNKKIKLLVAGEFYEKKEPYLELISRTNLQDRVILHAGFIDDTEVKYFICAGDCIIQPYRSATQSGVTPVAYHFEVPMIVTNVGGLPQMVPDGIAGIVCEANPNSLAGAVDTFFGEDPDRFRIGLLEEKKKLSWKTFTEGIFHLGESL
jgi:glycosyltransferase involved in cell wall biosynthesis